MFLVFRELVDPANGVGLGHFKYRVAWILQTQQRGFICIYYAFCKISEFSFLSFSYLSFFSLLSIVSLSTHLSLLLSYSRFSFLLTCLIAFGDHRPFIIGFLAPRQCDLDLGPAILDIDPGWDDRHSL